MLLFAASLLFVFPSQAQETLPDKIQNYFQSIQNEFPTEKVYLHLDKRTYTLGDDVWFSAYLLAGSSQIPSPLSSTLYVDIFDGSGLLLEQRKVRMEDGLGEGDFKISRFGKTGTYQIKAYTAWMRNFGEDYFLTTSFVVVDGAGGSFLPKINFTEISNSGGQVKYQVEIDALSSTGTPLANQTLEIRALAGDTELHKQSLALNAQGQASFSFSIPEKPNPSQSLELTYYENGDYPVTQTIRLPYVLTLADIQFLPEGGNLVIGKKSNVAFRAIDPDGAPVEIKGEIEGQSFATRFGGMGKVEFTPTKADYSATISNPKTGETRTVSLPKANENGLVVQVLNNPGAAFITVFVQGDYNPNSLLLVSQTRGVINYMIKGALANGVWGVRIPKENLISGINHITVLNSEGKPLLERLIFVQNNDFLNLDINFEGALNPRDKIALELTSTFQDQLVEGSFSIAVSDADQVSDESNEFGNIFSTLLLTSDLRGRIHQPGYYFKDQEAETLELLDLVMLTHGWRRFIWDDVMAGNLPEISHFIEQGITIEGQVSEQQETRKGLAGGKVNAILGEGIEMVVSEFGENGRFIFTGLDFQDSVPLTISAEDSKVRKFVEVEIIETKPIFSTIDGIFPAQIVWPEALVATFEERNLLQKLNEGQDVLELDGVTVEAETYEKDVEENKKIYGSGDRTIRPEEISGSMGFTNIFQLIQGRVAGVQISGSGFSYTVKIRGVGSISSGTEPLYLLNNTPVDQTTLLQVSPKDVSSIDVFKDQATSSIFGVQGANGVIAVYTKTGAELREVSVGGTLVTQYGGYHSPREFYSPKYDEKTAENATTDSRATIYWNPAIRTDANGKAKVDFFNSDAAKRQLIIIEGMDSEGRLGRAVKIIQ